MKLIFLLLILNRLWSLPIIVGISGGSGSGKTTYAQMIKERLGIDQCSVLHLDNYYKILAELPQPPNFDHPDAIDVDLLYDHLSLLKQGVAIEQPTYDFITFERIADKEMILPQKVIILEGFLIFSIPKIRELLDLNIYLDADVDISFIRQLERDMLERKRSYTEVKERYLSQVKPAYLDFVLQAKRYAHLIIPNEGNNECAMNILLAYLKYDL